MSRRVASGPRAGRPRAFTADVYQVYLPLGALALGTLWIISVVAFSSSSSNNNNDRWSGNDNDNNNAGKGWHGLARCNYSHVSDTLSDTREGQPLQSTH
jgi:hypothetical protein